VFGGHEVGKRESTEYAVCACLDSEERLAVHCFLHKTNFAFFCKSKKVLGAVMRGAKEDAFWQWLVLATA
jgi:hypothetical protein